MAAGNPSSSGELESGRGVGGSATHATSSGSATRRRDGFNPCVIVLQILVLQTIFYFSLSLFGAFLNWLFSVYPEDFSAQLLGSPAPGVELRVLAAASILTAAGPAGLALALLVRRARRCADHAATLLLAHIIICVSLHGLPHIPLWWVLQVSSTVVMSVVAEHLCRIIEARERNAFKSDINAASKSIGEAQSSKSQRPTTSGMTDSRNFSTTGAQRSVDISMSEEEVSLLVDEV